MIDWRSLWQRSRPDVRGLIHPNLSTLMDVGLTEPIVGYVILPAQQRQKRPWMQVADVAPLMTDHP